MNVGVHKVMSGRLDAVSALLDGLSITGRNSPVRSVADLV